MVPLDVICEDCGQIAMVRGYGRVEYDWPKTTNPGSEATTPTINYVRLAIDCPCCGVKSQDFRPDGGDRTPQPPITSAIICDATGRRHTVQLRTFRPATERRSGLRKLK